MTDPAMVAARSVILEPPGATGVDSGQVTVVIGSHRQPDPPINIALVERARVHDVQAVHAGDDGADRPVEGLEPSDSIRLIETLGHPPQDVTALVGTDPGVVAATHARWFAQGPARDPFGPDAAMLLCARARILAVAELIAPGRGRAFVPGPGTPR